MSRPASGTDLRLLKAGKELLRDKGITGLSVREACRRAKANTGMFHYYFGSKDEFLKAVLKEMYGEFLANFKVGVAEGADPRKKLKNALIAVGGFAREIKNVAPVIIADLILGNKDAFDFIRGNFMEHIGHIAALAGECRPQSALKGRSVPYMIGALVPVMIFPVIIGGIMERNGVKKAGGIRIGKLAAEFFSDEGIADRAEIALRGAGL
ncbi:MAG: TetR/AcrR family transcriptional regulator [Elusimicrobia bacterium]|nr:TetR/AcrR family transcriptional regulator [Elusimicrobiota bacterium]